MRQNTTSHISTSSQTTKRLSKLPSTSRQVPPQHINLHTRLVVLFLESSNRSHIDIAWAPGHKSIVGNERADTLSKATTELAIDDPPISLSYEKAQTRQRLVNSWTAEWH